MPKPRSDTDPAADSAPDASSVPETRDVMVPNRVVYVNPLSKGNLGKTTFYEYFIAALSASKIAWSGANMDNRHPAFRLAHRSNVIDYYNVGVKEVDEYHPVFQAARRSKSPVYLVDQRAQADLAFLQAARDTGFLKSCRDHRVRLIPVAIALDDLEYIKNLMATVEEFARDGVTRWLVVTHKDLHDNAVFMRSGLMEELQEQNCVIIDMPYLSTTSMAVITALNTSPGGPYGFREALEQPLLSKHDMSGNELSARIQTMERQFIQHEAFLLPEGVRFAAPVEIDMTPTDAPSRRDTRERRSLGSAFLGDDDEAEG